MTPDVIKVKPLHDYCIEVLFEDGQLRIFDMKPYLEYPAFSSLISKNLFMKVHVAFGTVAWNDEIDISPDTIYLSDRSSIHDCA